jgi:hypothetical protein
MNIKQKKITSKNIHNELLIYIIVSRDRRPSYTDRILISPISKHLKILQYSSMNDIKLSDHRPVFADIILYQQSTDNKTPTKSVIIFLIIIHWFFFVFEE